MPYNSNKSYGNGISYSFSSQSSGVFEYTPTSNQQEYSNKIVISYSGNSNMNYNSPFFSDKGDGASFGSNSSYIGNVSGKGAGTSKGGGGGRGAGRGKGMSNGLGGRGGMKQACTNTPKFGENPEEKFQSDESDLSINKTQQTDSDKQKNILDIMIEKLEEKAKENLRKAKTKKI